MLSISGLVVRRVCRTQNGKISITDGPFAAAKELIGGYVMYQVQTREEAGHRAWFVRLGADETDWGLIARRFDTERA